jgi:hypothetical protein
MAVSSPAQMVQEAAVAVEVAQIRSRVRVT